MAELSRELIYEYDGKDWAIYLFRTTNKDTLPGIIPLENRKIEVYWVVEGTVKVAGPDAQYFNVDASFDTKDRALDYIAKLKSNSDVVISYNNLTRHYHYRVV